MKPSLSVQISIPEPCHEDWNKMAPKEQGRFCDACQKCVTDFTGFSDDELYEFIVNNRGNKICGRFKNSQLNREILPHIPPQPHSQLYRWMVAAGLALIFSVTPESKLFAQAPIEQTQVIAIANNEHHDIEGDSTVTISGVVLDENGEPIMYAVAAVLNLDTDTVISGTVTDTNGNYQINVPPHLNIKLTISYIGYKSIVLHFNNHELISDIILTHTFEPAAEIGLMHIEIVQYETPLIDKSSTGNNRIISGEEIQNMSR